MLFSVFKILFKNSFAFSGFKEEFKKGGKGIAKNIALIVCMVYLAVVLLTFVVTLFSAMYAAFKSVGQTDKYLVASFLMAGSMVLFLGTTFVVSTYYTGSGETQFVSLPLRPFEIFGAKFLYTILNNGVIGLVVFAIAGLIYGANEHLLLNPLFYVGLCASGVTVSVVSVSVLYGVLVLLFYFCPFLRKKQLLTAISTVFCIVFAFTYGLLSAKFNISAAVSGEAAAVDPSLFLAIADKGAFLRFFARALEGSFASSMCLYAISALFVFGFMPLLSNLYIASLNGFSDVKTKKLTKEQTAAMMKKDTAQGSVFKALLLRDIKTMLREPTFFANGPLSIFLLPIIFIVLFVTTLVVGDVSLSSIIAEVRAAVDGINPAHMSEILYYATFIASAVFIYFTNASGVAATSFSRDGKSFYILKALPVPSKMIVRVKFCHALLYVFAVYAMIVALLVALLCITRFPVSPAAFVRLCVIVFLNGYCVSQVLILIDMFIDTANPKLQWEQPAEALKQNFNSFFAMLIALAVVALFVVLALTVLPKNTFGALIVPLVFLAGTIPLRRLYYAFAEKRIRLM